MSENARKKSVIDKALKRASARSRASKINCADSWYDWIEPDPAMHSSLQFFEWREHRKTTVGSTGLYLRISTLARSSSGVMLR